MRTTTASRRRFLRTAVGSGAFLGLADLALLSRLRPVSAAEASLNPNVVQMRPEIEPLVRFLEETPRDRLLEEVAARIQRGLSYRDILAALLLAGVKNVQPRPSVGFKFHAVLVVNSAHLASLSGPDADRWLPIFWALDYFKSSQARDVRENDWTMAPVDESAVPSAAKARKQFIQAMEQWDEPAADAAVASLARSASSQELFDIFCRYGARDFRSIGHKAIFVANSWRALQCIGWHHAEPVLRSLAYALLNHDGDNPAKGDAVADRPWRQNIELAAEVRPDWREGRLESDATREMLQTLREGTFSDAAEKAAELLNQGISPNSVWDGIFDGSGELLARQPGIVGLHTLTTSNALYHAYTAASDDETRLMMLLQNASFLTMFRDAMPDRGKVGDTEIDSLEAQPMEDKEGDAAVEEILADVRRNSDAAARKTLGYLSSGGDAEKLIDAARVMVFLKGTDSHDYKFSSAVLEDFYHVSPAWRDRFLASSMYWLRGSSERDNGLVNRIRSALA